MMYFSTFSGIGGFELGIQLAYESLCDAKGSEVGGSQSDTQGDQRQRLLTTQGEDISTEKRPASERTTDRTDQRPLCIGYSEIDKYAIQIYQKHFPEHKNYGDITTINAEELPDFNLLVGGFPCQSFSIAGKRGGFADTRGTLFFDIARILKAKNPRYLCLENVKGLLSHDNGSTFKIIISTLDELGYDCQWQVLNSKNHGVPQNRERVFIIGHLRGTSRPEVFPFGEDDEVSTERPRQISPTITSRYYKQGQSDPYVVTGSEEFTVKISEATKQGYAIARHGDSINLSVPNSKTRRGRVGKGIAQTLDTGMQQHTLDGARIRRLTPIECERLQGFPDGWTEGVSDTQRYKCLGNAVTVNVIRDIFKKIV